MKRIALLVCLCALLFTVSAWADAIDLTNQFGTVTITTAGVVSQGSQLLSFNGIKAPKGHALGSVSFATGALSSGGIWTGGTFSSVGSSFVVTGVGNYGQPKGPIFTGAFIGPIFWTVVSHTGKNDYVFALSGTISGMLYTGRNVSGTTTQIIYAYQNQWFQDHKGGIHLGKTQIAPEPGTLGLFGTGLIAFAGAMRRKFGVGRS